MWLAELARVLPELAERYPDLPRVADDETTARSRLFEALARMGQARTLELRATYPGRAQVRCMLN